ncbi:MAG: serine/threonine-protein kinase [Nocardioides sp.]
MSITAGYPVNGQRIGPYRVLRRIGGGGMGVVYEAEDEGLGRRVALKVIAPHLAEDDEFRARFTREAQALAALDSPHVVHVYTHDDLDGRLYLATQLIPDGDLGSMLREYGAPPSRVGLDLMAQVAAGLADAHAAGLIHRDIKPSNILLRRREREMVAYLGDFGVARQLGAAHTRSHTGTIGTPSYMAPELHTGGSAGVATDIYSLGCLLWATLSGQAPYTGTTEYQIVSAHLEEPIPQLDDTGPLAREVNRILRTAMAKDPAQRYSSVALLRDDLRLATGLPRTGPAGAATPTMSSRTSVLVAIGIAVAIALVVGLIALLASRGGSESGTTDPATDPASVTGPSPSTATSSPASSPVGSPDASAVAVAESSLAEALVSEGVLTEEQAACTAREWIAAAGLEEMAEAGFFDAEWTYVDQDESAMTPEIRNAATSAALACAGA